MMKVEEEQEEEVEMKDVYIILCSTHFEERWLPFVCFI